MAKAATPKYLFRGTTIGFKGNAACQNHKYTCTSTHPVIALLFAMECAGRNPDTAVVYVAERAKLLHARAEHNVLKRIEQEFVIGLPPHEFYTLTEGYIHYRELQKLLEEAGYEVKEIVRKDKLTELCTGVQSINAKELESLMSKVIKKLKKTKLDG